MGLPGAIDNEIDGRWHTDASLESVEAPRHQGLTRQFFETHVRGCTALFNKHKLEQDMEVKAIHIPTDKASCSDWACEDVVSRSRFRRTSRRGKSYFTRMPLHRQNAATKKLNTAINILLAVRTVMKQEEVDMVAGDFQGASWRRRSGLDQHT